MQKVENKVSDVSGLITNTAFNMKLEKLKKIIDHDKHVASWLATDNFAATLKPVALAAKMKLLIS